MNKLLVSLLVMGLIATSCDKEHINHPPPSIEFITGNGFVFHDTVLQLGAPFKIGIRASNPKVNLTNFIIKLQTDDMETYLDSGMNTPQLHFERTLVKGIAETEDWIFIIRDKDGKSAELNLQIDKDAASTYGPVDYFPSVIMGAQHSETGSFYATSTDSVYGLSAAFANQELIDLCYYFDEIETDAHTIASPGANIDPSVFPGAEGLSNWTTKRTTRFKPANITYADFLNATSDSLLVAVYGQTDGNRKSKNLEEGIFVAFKNNDGKLGIFMVRSITEADSGDIILDIKVQKN